MYNLKDKVRVTERAKKDTYENAWWTEKDLIIDHVEKEHDLSDEGQGLYSFVTVDGEEVPCSLYDYELKLVESIIPSNIQERLDYNYELVEYSVDANIEEDEEISFLENIFDGFSEGSSELDTLIRESMDPFYGDTMQDKLEYAFYIEDYVNKFIDECGVKTLEQALNGGIREYLFAQFFKNAEAIYKNLIYAELNCRIEDIKNDYNENLLTDLKTNFLNFEPSEVEDLVDDFINTEYYADSVYEQDCDKFYLAFCEFLSGKIED